MVLLLKDYKIYLTNSTNTQCYICLEPVNYYYKFNCDCHNFFHKECIEHNNVDKCLICNKKNTKNIFIFQNSEIFDFTFSEKIIDFLKIIKFLEIFLIYVELYPNILTFYFFLIINFSICFFLILPIVVINISYNFTKKIFY